MRAICRIIRVAQAKCAKDDFVLICWEDHVRKIVILTAVLVLAGCATANTNGGQQAAATAAANMPEPRTPDVFRKPAPVVGRWGFGVGYGSRY